MPRQIFVNLPVKNLDASVNFFTALGFAFNQQFTDETATCMIIEDGSIYAMLLTEAKFKTFTPKAIADATKTSEVLICISCDSREAIHEIVSKAVAAGGSTYADSNDHGFMFQHGFQDLDGHIWEVMWMNPSFVQ
ncbi:MAG: VOC family protein [Caulobacterales bacterium]